MGSTVMTAMYANYTNYANYVARSGDRSAGGRTHYRSPTLWTLSPLSQAGELFAKAGTAG